MTLYLQLDGNTSYIQSPIMTFNEIIMDITPRQTATNEYYIDARTGGTAYIYSRSDGAELYSGLTPYWNGTTFGSGTQSIGSGTRGTLRVVLSSQMTDDLTFLAGNAHTYNMASDVYSIKVLLNGVVQAFYDMSTGTVQDQSGNAYNATFSGGTWVNDGTGGAGTTYAGSGTVSGLSNLTSSDDLIMNVSGSSIGSISTTSNETKIYYADGTALGNSTLSSSENIVSHTGISYSASGIVQGNVNVGSTDKVKVNSFGNSQGTTILSVGEHIYFPVNGTTLTYSNVSSKDALILKVQGNSQGISNINANERYIFYVSGKTTSDSSVQSNEIMSYSAKGTSQGIVELIAQEIIEYLTSGTIQGNSILVSKELIHLSIGEYQKVIELVMTIYPQVDLVFEITPSKEFTFTV